MEQGLAVNRGSVSWLSVVSGTNPRQRGPLAGEAERIARGAALAATGWFRPDELARVAHEHRSGRSDHGRLLWQLLMLDKSLTRLFGA